MTDLATLARRPGLPELLAALGQGTARFVGGAVRDTLLGLPVQDLDLATSLSPYEVMRRLGAADIRTVPTGIAHGTVTAISRGQVAEITTLRSDVTTDGRRATVAFTDDWKADAERRDFTINALYWDPADGAAPIDYFGGLDDLAAAHVRFIGEPLQRIAEDHLRILRFFRFHARFGRGAPDPAALAACTARANDLMALSRERIADELLKLLALPAPAATVAVMLEAGILRPVLPEIESAALPRLERLVAAEAAAGTAPDGLRRLAALLPPDPALAERVAARLKISNKARARIAAAADPALGANPRALAYALGSEGAADRLLLADRPGDVRALAGWTVPRLPIGGGELIRRGLAPGPVVAATLRAIERQWVAAGFPEGEPFEAIVGQAMADAPVAPARG
ncbi:CCA tRNA nucleotidyltransferase [Sphingomonas ginkgonis]|uniref:CCA tRNA nucleotidyltransferase n=1 Tax=Sphingomonas ginkgonis TaxID=2315330 RepID=A0A429VCF7_9SPHN|nr:CCA tRNA nucleotidyltransferase [Sphingomonas ginkgonis]RST31679.1 CCA tRNA nucleotidyltransferase [Sphingomonas ginkgonis]